jgi:hypothetical protein
MSAGEELRFSDPSQTEAKASVTGSDELDRLRSHVDFPLF